MDASDLQGPQGHLRIYSYLIHSLQESKVLRPRLRAVIGSIELVIVYSRIPRVSEAKTDEKKETNENGTPDKVHETQIDTLIREGYVPSDPSSPKSNDCKPRLHTPTR